MKVGVHVRPTIENYLILHLLMIVVVEMRVHNFLSLDHIFRILTIEAYLRSLIIQLLFCHFKEVFGPPRMPSTQIDTRMTPTAWVLISFRRRLQKIGTLIGRLMMVIINEHHSL
jgi:hypothetical protein